MDMVTCLNMITVMGIVTGLDSIIVMDMGVGLAGLDADVGRERERIMVVELPASFAKVLHASQAACFDLFGGGMRGRFSRMHGRSELVENAAEDSSTFGV